mmetsp:Transcript_21032/g.29488  ORF Transcript_21032/g.29488 Transcript_21032/m.29488 type:complete len:195 (+) Transcript_21032:350-934(+)
MAFENSRRALCHSGYQALRYVKDPAGKTDNEKFFAILLFWCRTSYQIFCAKNTSKSIARFYLDIFQFPVRYDHEHTKATIFANNMAQEIHFVEKKEIDVDADNEEHMAIYIGNFKSCFERCKKIGIIWVNPRFTMLDASKTLEQALQAEAFRIRDIKDPDTGTKLLRLEHEIRSLRHPRCPLTQYGINKKKSKM